MAKFVVHHLRLGHLLLPINDLFLLVASFSGLYCSIKHLHDNQCQPASLMNTQLLFIVVFQLTHTYNTNPGRT